MSRTDAALRRRGRSPVCFSSRFENMYFYGQYPVTIAEEDGEVTEIAFRVSAADRPSPLTDETFRQVAGMIEGSRVFLDVPVRIESQGFHRRVIEALMNVPPGESASYMQLAAAAGNGSTGGARSAGLACSNCPLAFAVPTHRVRYTTGARAAWPGPDEIYAKLWENERKYRLEKKAL